MSSYTNNENDIDIGHILGEVGRHKLAMLLFMAIAGGLTFLGLSMVKPVYMAQSRILIENAENNFTKSSFNQNGAGQNSINNAAVGSQVQVLKSNDLAQKVIKELDLGRHYQSQSAKPLTEEAVLRHFLKNVSVSHIPNTNVIGVRANAYSPELSAQIANKLSGQFLQWLDKSKINETVGATTWLQEQINELRGKVASAETVLEKFRSKHGMLTGENNVTLDTQQLTAVNRALLEAKTQNAVAQSRVQALQQINLGSGNISATKEVLGSGFIQSLVRRRVAIEGRISELSSALMPSHPQMKRLSSELRDLKVQIRTEMKKVIVSVKNEARITAVRESNLGKRLSVIKERTGRNGKVQAQLKEMERDLKANRQTLVGYMNRYQDASGRRDNRALPTKASIISKAYMSSVPSFPKSKMAYSLMAAFAAGLLALLYYGSKAIISVSGRQAQPQTASQAVPQAPVRPAQMQPAYGQTMYRRKNDNKKSFG